MKNSTRSAADLAAIAFAVTAIVFLLCGQSCQVRHPRLTASVLAPADPQQSLIEGSGFALNAVYPSTRPSDIAGGIKFYGSWLNSDESIGAVHSRWYVPAKHFSILVAGYPHQPGIQLFGEWTNGSTTERLPISPPDNPGEIWTVQPVNLPASAHVRRFRIVAEDSSRRPAGWIGFSEPFVITERDSGEIGRQVLWVILTTLTAFVLLMGPGLVLRYYLMRLQGRVGSPVWLPVPGLLLLACFGLFIWKGSQLLSPNATARLALWPLVLFVFFFALWVPLSEITNAAERRVLLALVLLAGIAVGKSIYSVGPAGELYGGYVSRTLEVGDRSDSRIPYHVVQLVTSREKAFSKFANQLFGPWNFSHRGPIAGLAASPLVLAGPVYVPEDLPYQPWTVFDPEGFSAYRISMIVMASCMLFTVFGLACVFVPEPWAFVVFLATATAPFVIHEIYFTWPKIVAAGFVLLAVYLLVRSRPLTAGLTLGLGYLSHPSALVWTPALFAVSALALPPGLRSRTAKFTRWVWQSGALTVGLAVWLLFWRVINRNHYEQSGFFVYFTATGGLPPSLSNWLLSRWQLILNTLVPLHSFLFDRANPSANVIGGTSPPIVQFFFQYWNTLPFGVGIGFYFCLPLLFYRTWRKAAPWLLWVFGPSFLLLTAYMGVDLTGLLRDGLHAWVLGFLLFTLVISQGELSRSAFLRKLLATVLLLRTIEVIAMLLLPSIGTHHIVFREQFVASDIFALLLMLGGTIWVYSELYDDIVKCGNAVLPLSTNDQKLFPKKTPKEGQLQV